MVLKWGRQDAWIVSTGDVFWCVVMFRDHGFVDTGISGALQLGRTIADTDIGLLWVSFYVDAGATDTNNGGWG